MKERQFQDLRDFLSYLRDEGEMVTIEPALWNICHHY